MRFDAIDSPWINAIYLDGTEKEIGLRQTFAEAQLIKEIRIRSQLMMEEYAVYCFLFVTASRAFKLHSRKKYLDIEKRQQFDMAEFDEYISNCRKTMSFDIFDKEHPFLQKHNGKYKEEKLAKMLPPTCVAGNTAAFFRMRTDDLTSRKISPKNYLIALLGKHRISLTAGRGYTATPFAASPVPMVAIVHGKNLLETILAGTPIVSEPNWQDEKPFWETGEYEIPKGLFGKKVDGLNCWISNAFMPVRYMGIRKHDEEGNITSVFYEPILLSETWGDAECEKPKMLDCTFTQYLVEPHIFIDKEKFNSKSGLPILRYSVQKSDRFKTYMLITKKEVDNMHYALDSHVDKLRIIPEKWVLYGEACNQANLESQDRIEIAIPDFECENKDLGSRKKEAWTEMLDYVSSVRGRMYNAIIGMYGEIDISPKKRSTTAVGAAADAVEAYHEKVFASFDSDRMGSAVPDLNNADTPDAVKEWTSTYAKKVKEAAMLTLADIAPVRGRTAEKAIAINRHMHIKASPLIADKLYKAQKTTADKLFQHLAYKNDNEKYPLRKFVGKSLDKATPREKMLFIVTRNAVANTGADLPENFDQLIALTAAYTIDHSDSKRAVKFETLIKRVYQKQESILHQLDMLARRKSPLSCDSIKILQRLLGQCTRSMTAIERLDISSLCADLLYWEMSDDKDKAMQAIIEKWNNEIAGNTAGKED